ncbi:AMP-binding protein [Paraburkholderia sediminicola]|uniref:AMP-binding protein n=1 Tax=Paraburkholderia sediminicola TaxID=458836 RepID=UPI0038BCFFB1
MQTYLARGYDWESTRLAEFIRRYGYRSLADLQAGSTQDPSTFWAHVADYLDLGWASPYRCVLDLTDGPVWPRWFAGGSFDLFDHLVGRWARLFPHKVALRWEGDWGETRDITYAGLLDESSRLAEGLTRLGVRRGERVAMYLPMLPEASVLLLACARIGAIVSPLFSGFGADALAARVRDCEAKLLVCADGYYRRGKPVDMLSEARRAVQASDSVQHLVVVQRLLEEHAPVKHAGPVRRWTESDYDGLVKARTTGSQSAACEPDTPLAVIYTSGTSGQPKGVVHTHAGFPIKAASDLVAFDFGRDDTLMWVTDMGWLMGPWMVFGALLHGATCVLCEGTVDFPAPDRLWKIAERYQVTHLGLSPTLVRLLMAAGDQWLQPGTLCSLRVFGSTGELWSETPWQWLFERVGQSRRPIVNYTGGTEIGGGILASFPGLPQKPGSFTGPIPGMPADVLRLDGQPARTEVGELALHGPWPGMTQRFWCDPGRYEETYWRRWPQIWAHGDCAYRDNEGFWFLQGRSDDIIKVGGKRIGSGDYESALMSHPVVSEAVAVGVPDDVKGEAQVCFCRKPLTGRSFAG